MAEGTIVSYGSRSPKPGDPAITSKVSRFASVGTPPVSVVSHLDVPGLRPVNTRVVGNADVIAKRIQQRAGVSSETVIPPITPNDIVGGDINGQYVDIPTTGPTEGGFGVNLLIPIGILAAFVVLKKLKERNGKKQLKTK